MNNSRVVLGFLISVILIYLIIWEPKPFAVLQGDVTWIEGFFGQARLDFSQILFQMSQASGWWLIITFLITPLHVLVRSHRWILLLKSIKTVKLSDSYSLQMIGYFTSTVLPLRIGEVIRGLLLGKKYQMPRSTALTTVLVERLVDVISLLAVFAIVGVMYKSDGVTVLREGALILAVFSFGVLGLVLYLVLARNPLSGLVGKIISWMPKRIQKRTIQITENAITGFGMLKSADNYLLITVETILLWVLYTAQEFSVIIAFGFHRDYEMIAAAPLTAALVILVINAVALSIPSAPSGIGTFHAASIFALGLFGIAEEPAIGFALVLHALTVVFYTGAGFGFMWREGLRLNTLKQIQINET